MFVVRRDDRVADRAALEMLCTRKGTEGSNPSLSASNKLSFSLLKGNKPFFVFLIDYKNRKTIF